MRKGMLFPALVLGFGSFAASGSLHAQGNAPEAKGPISVHVDGWLKPVPGPDKNRKPGPAPKHDLSGIWEPTPNYRDGVFATGPKEYPSDGKPEHQVPFTPEGEKAWKANKPGFGTNAVPIAQNNDPFDKCDPIGFPRIELFNLRAIQIFQAPKNTAIIYENDQIWRNIWTDGRQLPNYDDVAEPRWFGYSVGKWTDDYTFVVDTVGLNPETWIDNVGRPHSDQLKVEEVFHRIDSDTMELTMTITDPVMYTKPWSPLKNFKMRLQPDWFDIREMICAPSETVDYDSNVSTNATPGTPAGKRK